MKFSAINNSKEIKIFKLRDNTRKNASPSRCIKNKVAKETLPREEDNDNKHVLLPCFNVKTFVVFLGVFSPKKEQMLRFFLAYVSDDIKTKKNVKENFV